jgi:hypothetical protein
MSGLLDLSANFRNHNSDLFILSLLPEGEGLRWRLKLFSLVFYMLSAMFLVIYLWKAALISRTKEKVERRQLMRENFDSENIGCVCLPLRIGEWVYKLMQRLCAILPHH